MIRSLLVVVLLAGAGLLIGVPAQAATSSTCTSGHGVTVVVDGGKIAPTTTGCAPTGGGHLASWLFARTGSRLTWVERDPSFVCHINGQPADQDCVNDPPANAYWSLWVSDGHTGWQYASLGANELTVPNGGSVAFVWNTGGSNVPPSTPPMRSGHSRSAGTTVAGAPTVRGDLPANEQPAGSTGGSGLPGWVPPAVIGLVVVAIAGASLVRRKER